MPINNPPPGLFSSLTLTRHCPGGTVDYMVEGLELQAQ